MKSSFAEALSNGEIKIFYQPIIHLISGNLCAYEALSRWDCPGRGLLKASTFLDELDYEQIEMLDKFVIWHVCETIRGFIDEGHVAVPVSINISYEDIVYGHVLDTALEAIKKYNLRSELLRFELAEELLQRERASLISEMNLFRKNGFGLWLDHFGRSFSSLNLLIDLPIDLLKIDGSLLAQCAKDQQYRIVLKNIMNTAKELGIQTLAEGVESYEVKELLAVIGCEQMQGYLCGQAAPLDIKRHESLNPENDLVRDYFDAIGKVNVLSQTPLQTGWSHLEDDVLSEQGLPLAIMEFNGSRFHFLMANDRFANIITSLGTGDETTCESIFNDDDLQFAHKIHDTAEQCIMTGEEMAQDFVTEKGFMHLRLRCISYNVETDDGALLAIIEDHGEDSPEKKQENMNSVLRFLYTLYSRIDMISADGNVENIYLDSSSYMEAFIKGNLRRSISTFAKRNIHPEDQFRFIQFFDLGSANTRIRDAGGRYLKEYFRTLDAGGSYSWQIYILIPAVMENEQRYLVCSRGTDAARDSLTGLQTRNTALPLIKRHMQDAKGRATLIIVDLDNFKNVNDSYGHPGGDAVLKDIASRMREKFQYAGIVSRLGGDEFIIFLRGLKKDEVDELLMEFCVRPKSVVYQDQTITYTVSIGYAVYPDNGNNYKDLYQKADLALYEVKQGGKDSYHAYDISLSKKDTMK